MNRFYRKLGIAGLLTVFSAASLFAQYPDTVKIMTYNINAETHTDGDYTDIGDVVKAINPTIAGLQKVDSCTVTAAPVYVLKALGQQAGMFYTFSESYTKNGGSYGNGFLSDSVPKSKRHLAIPKGSASEERSALEIGVTIGGEPVRVIVTHLDYSGAAARTAEMKQILSWVDSGGAKTVPAMIMADFNAQSTEECMKQLTDAGFVFVKGANGVILDSTQKINHILYRPENRWKIVDASNPVYAASNRNPLWALMSLANPVASKAMPVAVNHGAGRQVFFKNGEIRFNLSSRAEVTLRLFDPSGRLCLALTENKELETGPHAFALPGSGLTKGTYFLESDINGWKMIEKVAIVK